MVQNKTLIAYETKGGATEESARKIAEVLRSKFQLEVDLVDLKKQDVKNCAQYNHIVIGDGSVRRTNENSWKNGHGQPRFG